MSDLNLDMRVDSARREALLRRSGLAQEAINRAMRRAVAKTARWAKAQAARAIRADEGIAYRAIRRRLRDFAHSPERMALKVWLGLWRMAAYSLGRADETDTGVSVGRRRYPGAFLATLESGHKGVFRRRGSRRLPIAEVMENWGTTGESAMRQAAAGAEARLLTLAEQELRFELLKVTGNV